MKRHQRWKLNVNLMIVMKGDVNLFYVIPALSPTRGRPSLLDRRQQKRHQNGDDRDHHQ